MSEKKVFSGLTVIGLWGLCFILFVGLAGTMANYTYIIVSKDQHYTNIINIKDEDIDAKDSQIETLTDQKSQLQAWLDDYSSLVSVIAIVVMNGNVTAGPGLGIQIYDAEILGAANYLIYAPTDDNGTILLINRHDLVYDLQNDIIWSVQLVEGKTYWVVWADSGIIGSFTLNEKGSAYATVNLNDV